MSINSTTSSSMNSAAVSAAKNANSNSPIMQKSSADSSFKEEMDKVTTTEKKDDKKEVENKTNTETKEEKVEKQEKTKKSEAKQNVESDENISDNQVEANENDASKFASLSMNDANNMLTNDIRQMINNSTAVPASEGVFAMSELNNDNGMLSFNFTNNLSMTQSDAEFFIALTQNDNISTQNIVSQAQSMISSGADASKVRQNVQISQALLNAINTAKENNQPLRVDFDQNISVVLRFGKDGALAANFIPGDKAVEQYLRNNIESLKATFNEQDLPYSELSYSNRGSKQQKEQRRNK
ncbi:hypothetical protein IJ541_05345 [bacterium]|nr:hypothetical protein [bacterium]